MPAIKDDAALLNDYPEQLDGEDAFVNAVLEDEDDKGDPEEGNDAPSEETPEEDAEGDEGEGTKTTRRRKRSSLTTATKPTSR
jgi:hypothetical protein